VSSTLGSTSGSVRISSAKQRLPGGTKTSDASEPRINLFLLFLSAEGSELDLNVTMLPVEVLVLNISTRQESTDNISFQSRTIDGAWMFNGGACSSTPMRVASQERCHARLRARRPSRER